MLGEKIVFSLKAYLVFLGFGITAFCFDYFGGETDINLESFIFAWAFRYLESLNALFAEINKSGSDCFSFFVFVHDVDG